MTHSKPNPRAQEPDTVLVARIRGGQTACFAELVKRYELALGRVARSRLGRADWADDVVQETLLAAYRGIGSYDPRYNFRTWLWTILLNQCNGHYQRRARSVPLEPLPADCEPRSTACGAEAADDSPLAALLARERAEQLETILGQLSEVQADALRLRFFGGLRFQEIADLMQCSLNTAKSRVKCGLTRMAELLQTTAEGARRDDSERER